MSRLSTAALAASALALARTGAASDVQSNVGRETLAQKYSIVKTPAAASSVVTPGVMTFFQDNFAPQTTNLVRPGQLAQGKGVFVARALSLYVGVDQETQGDSLISHHATAAVSAITAEGIRRILERGAISIKKGTRDVFTGFGLYNFPQGGGPFIQQAVATAVGATNLSIESFNICNGEPSADNMRWLPSPITFQADETVSLIIDFGATTFPCTTSDKIRIMASLWGSEFADAVN